MDYRDMSDSDSDSDEEDDYPFDMAPDAQDKRLDSDSDEEPAPGLGSAPDSESESPPRTVYKRVLKTSENNVRKEIFERAEMVRAMKPTWGYVRKTKIAMFLYHRDKYIRRMKATRKMFFNSWAKEVELMMNYLIMGILEIHTVNRQITAEVPNRTMLEIIKKEDENIVIELIENLLNLEPILKLPSEIPKYMKINY